MATAPKNAAPAPEAPVKSKKKKIVILLALTLVLLGGGGAAGWFFFMNPGTKAPAAAKPAAPPVFVPLDVFTVNLTSEGGAEQFLQVSMTLQVADAPQTEMLKTHMPQVKSRILMLLTSKTASQVSTIEGKKQLMQEILAQVKQPFAPNAKPVQVSDVFFTSFVIQ